LDPLRKGFSPGKKNFGLDMCEATVFYYGEANWLENFDLDMGFPVLVTTFLMLFHQSICPQKGTKHTLSSAPT
jgi:hypothetical protein